MKKLLGIILPAFLIGVFIASIIAYPAGVREAITNPWEAVQLTVYKVSGQEEKIAEIEERVESRQQSPEESEELLNEEIYPHLAHMP